MKSRSQVEKHDSGDPVISLLIRAHKCFGKVLLFDEGVNTPSYRAPPNREALKTLSRAGLPNGEAGNGSAQNRRAIPAALVEQGGCALLLVDVLPSPTQYPTALDQIRLEKRLVNASLLLLALRALTKGLPKVGHGSPRGRQTEIEILNHEV